MTDTDDKKLARRYRELSREEPRAALDAAILAASRRAVAQPSWSRRWAAPVSIAAVLVLAFGVTLQMQREVPGIESAPPSQRQEPAPAASAPVPEQAVAPLRDANVAPPKARAEAPQRKSAAAQPALRVPPPEPAGANVIARPLAKEERAPAEGPAPFPAASAPATMNAPAATRVAPSAPAYAPAPSPSASTAGALATPTEAAAQSAVQPSAARMAPRLKAESADAIQPVQRAAISPTGAERELERIAKLREEGRDADADKALEQFRRDHPDYRIADAMWQRVKPR
jgi:hypothetical protein